MRRYEAVLFDWMLTLAHYPTEREHVRRAHEALGREADARVLDAIVSRLITAARDDDVAAAMARADCSVEAHRNATMHLLERASVDADLAEVMYGLLGEPTFHPIYQDRLVCCGASPTTVSASQSSVTSTSTFERTRH